MAVRHKLIERPRAEVWAVLADAARYGDWVVGTDRSWSQEGHWPEEGASIGYTVRLCGRTLSGHTYVRRCEAPAILELEVDSGRLGTARIALDVREWGADTLVVLDEHPLRGPAGLLHNPLADALSQVRNRLMLSRLAKTVAAGSPRAEGAG
ncbi:MULTISPECIES: SRPBCC family protein [unclassified Streptomyces]|uniref:SRPBCC family protein n=1 Tax=unclassified Streptomyces TaxID=2593676 RepID=UPI0010139A79|nr:MULTISPECIES: SRPBCC family protein [unclassified Streptomyces]WEH27241.1 SRPBCC family protein [Streptomyces sp. AM 3-1-1]